MYSLQSAMHSHAPLTGSERVCCDMGRDQQKGEALGELFTRINESLEATGSFPPLGGEQGNEALPQAQGQAHVWTMFQLAQHYDMQGRTGSLLILDTQTVTNIILGMLTVVKVIVLVQVLCMHMDLQCYPFGSSCQSCT